MPTSYFATHTTALLVRREDLERLWNQDRIAIHYPGNTSDGPDNASPEPGDYADTKDRSAVGIFWRLGEEGGYVWAQSYVAPGMAKVGYVRGRREGGEGVVMDTEAKWELRGERHEGREDGYPAALKTLKFERVREIGPTEAMNLRAATPRGHAICAWPAVEDRLRSLVEEEGSDDSWSALSTAEQEAACSEYLRERHDNRPDLPVLARLLLPVGRTLKDVDVYGFAEDGAPVYAQVTHASFGSEGALKKAAILRVYGNEAKAHLVLFCRGGFNLEADGIARVSCDREVLPWVLEDEEYRRNLFDS